MLVTWLSILGPCRGESKFSIFWRECPTRDARYFGVTQVRGKYVRNFSIVYTHRVRDVKTGVKSVLRDPLCHIAYMYGYGQETALAGTGFFHD